MTLAVFNLRRVWHIAAIGLGLLLSVLATGHAARNKRDPLPALALVGFVWLVPWSGRSFASSSESIASGVRPLYCEGTWRATGRKRRNPNVRWRSCSAIYSVQTDCPLCRMHGPEGGGRASCNGFASLSTHQKGRQNALMILD
jgi:hypothetical protein